MINKALLKIILENIAYIFSIICIPLIVLGICILRKGKYKKTLIIITLILTLMIYIVSANKLIESASKIISVKRNISEKDEIGTDITFLKNYEQKMEKQKYLNKNDIIKILEIADLKSKEIIINYKDEKSNINISTTNKNDDEIQKIKEMLKHNYYTFNYDAKGKIVINITTYVVEEVKKQEKNNDIIISGKENLEIIESINKYNNDEKATYFKFSNKIVLDTEKDRQKIDKLRILLNYNKEINNYIPVTQDTADYEYVEEYTVYSNEINIVLKKGISLDKKDYTLRINRYDEKFNIIERENNNINLSYYYEYEPVVTETINSKGNTTLNMKFDRRYTINELKNIEIIY